jgi:uncharacterized protein YceK
MRTRAGAWLAPLLFCAVAGCGTFGDSVRWWRPESRPESFHVYGGVQFDLEAIKGCLAASKSADQGGKGDCGGEYQLGAIAMALDVPFSAVADTVLLPATLPISLYRLGE